MLNFKKICIFVFFLYLFSCLEQYFSYVILNSVMKYKSREFKATNKIIWIEELALKGKEKELKVFILAERQWRRDISL